MVNTVSCKRVFDLVCVDADFYGVWWRRGGFRDSGGLRGGVTDEALVAFQGVADASVEAGIGMAGGFPGDMEGGTYSK